MTENSDEIYMHRCLQLAQLGTGYVAPNPLVGAVLVHDNIIIGEGYHQQYGHAHAEVNCIRSVRDEHRDLIHASTMYVSLEPCAHFGKTPPCADLIIAHKIARVVVGSTDPFDQVQGRGVQRLQAAGVGVKTGVLEKECIQLNKRFFTVHQKQRPYIVLKWAQSADLKIAGTGDARTRISNVLTDRIVHAWRAEEMAIAVGTHTAFLDDPALTNRLAPGGNPIRMVLDRQLRLKDSLQVFDKTIPTIIFNLEKNTVENTRANDLQPGVHFCKIEKSSNVAQQITERMFQLNIQSVLIEGGAQLLQSFIDENLWDEARTITNEELIIDEGLSAPVLSAAKLVNAVKVSTDVIRFYQPTYR
jgi:diaminohydroxyphosphoribosylaminopyrimidine deaminase/5-amino-6-(5-phosphoribosylamino)uracil reductase